MLLKPVRPAPTVAAVSRPNPLLDLPAWAPAWMTRALRWAIGVVFVAGLVACMSEGANSPPDPRLAPAGDVTDLSDPDRASVCVTPEETFSDETEQLVATFGALPVTVTSGDQRVDLCALVASDPEQRGRGLMTVTGFDGFDGMVFVYDTDSSGGYYMFNTPTPLTIYWWDADGDLVSSAEMAPCLDLPAAECPRYLPDGPYRYALEVPLGALDGVVGDTATLHLGLAGG